MTRRLMASVVRLTHLDNNPSMTSMVCLNVVMPCEIL